MNRMHNRALRRYAVAFVLLILAGYISVFIKDTIDSRNPDVALPVISVTTGYSPIPNVPRAGYEWQYRTKSVMAPYVSSMDFSMPYKGLTLYESKGVLINGRVLATEDFTEKKYSNNTPNKEGIYVYKVVAQFEQGTIMHYFALDVSSKRSSI